MGSPHAEAFLASSRAYLREDYLPAIERCLSQLPDADVWWRPNDASNAVGNLLLHLRGNVAQWLLNGVGGRPFERDRAHEFAARGPVAKEDLMAPLRTTLAEADEVLAGVSPAQLLERRTIQGHDVQVQHAIYHVVEHFGMHTGQILWITKARTGRGPDGAP